jgi:sugar fermentation stimulation protein A
MELPKLVCGHFLRRDNRFRATVIVDGQEVWAHVPNSGRLTELFTPNRPVWLAPAGAPNRKTAFDLKLAEFDSVLVSVDARLPNPLLEEALNGDRISGLDYVKVEREITRGDSRLDFRLSGPEGVCWVETKSVTLVEDGVGLFPDAPTSRGRKHVQELIDARQSGDRATVAFVIQRPDAKRFRPHVEADPDLALALRQAAEAGVEVRAFTCNVSMEAIAIADEIPVMIP